MLIFKLSKKNLNKTKKLIIKAITEGEVIVCPTDTVYGLICDAKNSSAVRKIFKIKKRGFQKPISVFVKDFKMAKNFARIDEGQEEFLKKSWPGKLIAILKAKGKFPKGIVCEFGKIGIRIPEYKLLNEILKELKKPLAQTSANLAGKPTSATVEEILKQFKNKKPSTRAKHGAGPVPHRNKVSGAGYQPDLAIDAGKLSGKPSRVIDLTEVLPKTLRK